MPRAALSRAGFLLRPPAEGVKRGQRRVRLGSGAQILLSSEGSPPEAGVPDGDQELPLGAEG